MTTAGSLTCARCRPAGNEPGLSPPLAPDAVTNTLGHGGERFLPARSRRPRLPRAGSKGGETVDGWWTSLADVGGSRLSGATFNVMENRPDNGRVAMVVRTEAQEEYI